MLIPAGTASAGLGRDPVDVVYQRDHALHTLNNGATDDDLRTRTDELASSAWSFFRGTSPLFYRDLGELPPSAYAPTRTSPATGVSYSADAAIDGAIMSVSGLESETAAFATSYADQVDSDWQAYVNAKNAGRPLF